MLNVQTTMFDFLAGAFNVIGVFLPANQHPKSTVKKKYPTNLCAPVEFLKNVSAMFANHNLVTLKLD